MCSGVAACVLAVLIWITTQLLVFCIKQEKKNAVFKNVLHHSYKAQFIRQCAEAELM